MRTFALALFVSLFAWAAGATSPDKGFTMAYLKWKTDFHMSAFTPEEDMLINLRMRNGDCAASDFILRSVGERHVPKDSLKNTAAKLKFDAQLTQFKQTCVALRAPQ